MKSIIIIFNVESLRMFNGRRKKSLNVCVLFVLINFALKFLWWQKVWLNAMTRVAGCKMDSSVLHVQKNKNKPLSTTARILSAASNCFFHVIFYFTIVCLFFIFLWEKECAGDGIMRYMQFYYYLITGCFMIMLLYVLRLTSFFYVSCFCYKESIDFIVHLSCGSIHKYMKCEMRIVLSLLCVVVVLCELCSLNSVPLFLYACFIHF